MQVEPPQSNARPHKTWSITLFNTTTEAVLDILDHVKPRIQRCVACKDIAPTTEGEHYHVAIIFNNAMRFNAVKGIFGETAHIRWTTGDQNVKNLFNYVSGKGNHDDFKELIFEHNNYTTKTIKRGKKNDFFKEWRKVKTINHFYAMIQEDQWAEFNTEYKYIQAEVNLAKREIHERKFPRTVVWVYGDTGAGKSRMAHRLMTKWIEALPYDHCGEISASSTAGQVFGLQGDENMVLIDDIKADKMQTQDVLKLLDQYPQPQDVKGSWAAYNPDLVMVTCMKTPDNMGGKWEQDNIRQIERRITYLINVHQDMDHNVRYTWYDTQKNLLADMTMEATVTDLIEQIKEYLKEFEPDRLPKTQQESETLPH